MLLGGVNTIGAYSVKANRAWDNTHNREEYIAIYETGKIPCLQLFVDAATEATVQLYDAITEEVVGGAYAMTVTQSTTYATLTYLGLTLAAQTQGYYYLKITTDAETIYTDVFGWADDVSGYLKITATSTNVALHQSVKAIHSFTGFSYLVYVAAHENKEQADIQEKGIDLNGTTYINYGSTSIIESFDLMCNRALFDFFIYLRHLSPNGTVILEWKGESRYIGDIEMEEKEVHNGNDLYNATLRFKNPWRTMLIINTTPS
jgi:hypothetical protein